MTDTDRPIEDVRMELRELDAMMVLIARLHVDARRYRWLRDTRTDRLGNGAFAIRDCSLPAAETLDQSIDEAIKEERRP